jgi:hypothetical protein
MFGITEQTLRIAVINCFFNGARQLDDICLAGLPLSAEHATRILCKSGNDGVYPETIRDECGAVIQNPMSVKLERSGNKCAFLDMDLSLTPRHMHSTVYQKRDHMAVFQEDATTGTTAYRRFPHLEPKIADSAKYGVYTSQLHRFAGMFLKEPANRLTMKEKLMSCIHPRLTSSTLALYGKWGNMVRHTDRLFR